MSNHYQIIKSYLFHLILIASIVLGGFSGYFLGDKTLYLKPFGTLFIHLIFTAIVPLIFFSISSAIAKAGSSGSLGKIMSYMGLVFLFTGLVAAIYSLLVVLVFPPAQGVHIPLDMTQTTTPLPFSDQITNLFTVSEFSQLLSHQHILALIIFSILVGLSVIQNKEKTQAFLGFLQAGEEVFMRFFDLIMFYAPIGFFAYFAVLVHELGPQLMGNYLRVLVLYYTFALIYFTLAYTGYAYLSWKKQGIRLFWSNILIPMLTALATCSSAASIPANLAATKKMKVPSENHPNFQKCQTVWRQANRK